MSQLLIVENLTPIEVYNSGNIDIILNKIAEDARSQELDISTEKGRKEIASLAYKVAQSKTFLDKMGKSLGDEARKTIDTLNAERKKCVDFLDKLKDEIRAPLTEWENKEKTRIATHEAEIQKISQASAYIEQNWISLSVEFIAEKVTELASIDRDWEEFQSRAASEISNAFSRLDQASAKLTKHLNEQAELARFREAEAIRIQKERDEKIAIEAAEKAKQEAELRAKAEAARVARENEKARIEAEQKAAAIQREKDLAIQKAKDAEDRAAREKQLAEQRAKDAAIKAENDKKLAVESERKKIESEKAKALEAEKVREANKKHAAKINNEVVAGIMSLTALDETAAKAVVIAIASGKVPHTKITY